jgi:CO dehydrogenase/acetyl-CoA synthase epsilon subunit
MSSVAFTDTDTDILYLGYLDNQLADVQGFDVNGATRTELLLTKTIVTDNGSNYTVTAIKNNAFSSNVALQSVDFSGMGQLTNIGEEAFYQNTALTELKNFTNATNLKEISGAAFSKNSALQSVDFGGMGQLTSIGDGAFSLNTSLTELKNFTNATNLRSIGYLAFADNSSLQSVDFGGMGQLTSIGYQAFFRNTALTELKNFTNATNLRSIDVEAFRDNFALQSVDFGGMGQLTSIGDGAFYQNTVLTELKNFTNATKLQFIGVEAFSENYDLQSVDFSGMGQLTSIGSEAFYQNTVLTELKNFNSATKLLSIGDGAFSSNSALQSVDFGGMGQLTSIGDGAFYLNTSLTELKNFTNATNLLSIGDLAFAYNSALQSVDFGGMGQLTSIGYGAFAFNTSLTELKNFTNATNLLSIGDAAFGVNYSLQSVDFGGMAQLTSIGAEAFAYNTALIALNNFNYATSLKTIDVDVFGECSALQTIFFPSGITNINTNAFFSNISLRSIAFNDPSPTFIDPVAFADCSSLEGIYHYGADTTELNQLTALANGTLYDLTPDKVTFETYGTHIATALDSLFITNDLQISDIKNIYAANLIQIALNGTIFQPETSNIQVKVGAIPILATQLEASPTDALRLCPNYTTSNNRYIIGSNNESVYIQMNLGSVLYLNTDETITKNADNTYTYSGSGTPYGPGDIITIGGRRCVFGGFGIGPGPLPTIEFTDETTDIIYIGNLDNQLAEVKGFDANGLATRTELLLTKTIVTDNGSNYTVTAIKNNAFEENYELKSVDFSGMGQLTSIGEYAFYYNEALTELKNFTNATNLKEIGSAAFGNNYALQSVDFGGMGQLTSIGNGAFRNNMSLTELKNFTNATKLQYIDIGAFSQNSALQSVDFGGMGQLTSIGNQAFYRNTALTELKNFTNATKLLFINDIVFSQNYALQSVNFGGMGQLTSIGVQAFYNNRSLTELKNFTSATNLLSIDEEAFSRNYALQSVDFGGMGQLTLIDYYAFYRNTVLTELKNFTNATNLLSIREEAFSENYALQSVDFGGMGQLTNIGEYAFYQNTVLTELKNFTNATKLKAIGDGAFYQNYALQSVDFGGMGQLTSIGEYAFYQNTVLTELKNFTNATKLKAIGDWAFSENSALQSVDFGGMGQLTNIGVEAFYRNTALTELKNFTNATKLLSINDDAFYQNSALQSVDFGGMGQLTNIGVEAFNRNTALTELKNFTNATNLLSIREDAFGRNYVLQSVDFGGMGQLTLMDYYAFYLNTALIALNNFNYATSLKTINEGVFEECSSIQTIFFPSGLTEIQAYAFFSNISLKSITFNNPSPTSIDADAFANCTSLKSIYHYGGDITEITKLTTLANGALYDLTQDIVDYADYATYISSAFDNSGIEDPLQISDIKNTYAENLIQVALNGTIFQPETNIQVKVGGIPFLADQLGVSPTDTLRLYPNYTTPDNRYIIASNTDPVYIQMFLGSVLYLNTNETITKNADNTYTYSGAPSEVYQPGNSITINGKKIIFGGVTIGGGGGGGGDIPTSDICFPAGTPIQTDQGIMPINKINKSLHTINNQPILHITKTITLDKYLISFPANSISPNVPRARTIMTKNHKIMFQGKLIQAKHFLEYSKEIKKVNYRGEPLYNVLLENYSTIQVNGITCETLDPENIIAKLYMSKYNEEDWVMLIKELNVINKELNMINEELAESSIQYKKETVNYNTKEVTDLMCDHLRATTRNKNLKRNMLSKHMLILNNKQNEYLVKYKKLVNQVKN